MKIELKITTDELNYLEKKCLLIQGMDFRQLDKTSKNTFTIMLDVLDKVTAKAKTVNRKIGLFDQKKLHKITLKFHEAYILEPYMTAWSTTEVDLYNSNLCRKIISQLNKELA